MHTIYKYQLEIKDFLTIEMPFDSQLLCVQVQNDIACIWAVVDNEAPLVKRFFEIVGTGNQMDNLHNTVVRNYIGTFQMLSGKLIYHVFERINK